MIDLTSSNKRQDSIIHESYHDFSNPEVLTRHAYQHRRSPIIVTLGNPKIAHVDIQRMMEAGMNVVRLKISHCTKGEQIKLISKVDKASKYLCQKYSTLDWPVATCIELKTCIVRTGLLEGDEDHVVLKEGSHVILTYHLIGFDKCTAATVFVDNPYIGTEVEVGMTISIAHDEILLKCKKIIDDKSIKCIVTKSGKLSNLNLVTVRGAKKSRPLITKKDYHIVKFALLYQIDIIIVNYARQPGTFKLIKDYIGKTLKRPILLGGICTEEGLRNIDDIIRESDGIVFSREFLAYELSEESRHRLLLIQKWAGAKCQQAGKPFYISGEVFQEALKTGDFIDNEISNITNALIDGATGFMLKDCPNVERMLDVIKALNELCCNIEPLTNTKIDFWRILDAIQMPINAAEACAMSCALVANQSKARVIIIPTVTGQTAKILMWLRPASLVLTVSSRTSTTRRLQSYRCVIPLMFKGGIFKNWQTAIEARVNFAVEYAVKLGWLELGDSYVSLQRGSETSAFCDAVKAWNVTINKRTKVKCNDDTDKEKLKRKSTT